MPFKFNQKKTTQAVAFFLRQSGRSKTANYMRLIKLLYIADRESLKETGRPITGDCVVAMVRGPVLSHLLDLISDRNSGSCEWNSFIARDSYHIQLINDPGNSELCRYEIDKLKEIWDRYRFKDEWDMVQETHNFPEWKKNNPGNSSKPIPLSDILEAIGRKDDLEKIEQDAKESSAFSNFFQG